MSSQTSSRLSADPKQKVGNLLAKAGQFSLTSTRPRKFIQEVGDDQQFPPLLNITTTYIDQQGNPAVFSSQPAVAAPSKSRAASSLPKEFTKNDLQYSRLASQLRNNAKATIRSIARKKQQKRSAFFEEDEELAGVEQIIGEIQDLMKGNHGQNFKLGVKASPERPSHKKKGWHNKPIKSFSQNEGFAKLQQMLLNYKINEDQILKQTETPIIEAPQQSKAKRGDRKQKIQQRAERNKKYQEITKHFTEQIDEQEHSEEPEKESQPQSIPKNEEKNQSIIKKEPELRQNEPESVQSIEAPPPVEQSQPEPNKGTTQNKNEEEESLKLQDIELVEFDWNKLPIIFSPLTTNNSELFLRMRDHPEDQTFLDAISQVLAQEHTYNAYSIFDGKRTAGLNHQTLLSEQQFRQNWAQEWEHDVDEQQNKQLLCQFDFQWYRCLVQLTYSHSLQDILIKNIKYDPQLYLSNLKKIHGTPNDKNKIQDNLTLLERITFNRLKFIEALLTKFHFEESQRHHRINLVVGIIPTVWKKTEKEESQKVKQWINQLFQGRIYEGEQEEAMAVVITNQQAAKAKVETLPNQLIKLGKVLLLVNGTKSAQNLPKIYLRKQKQKNSMVRLAVQRDKNRQEIVLQVGEDLHCGRRYKIDLD